ncbi:MAG TPA: DUF2304 domain-containing protein [Desulfohalobiaceae bacterium]|nr:DUF2304 domain-containing protein [Desulfohalobiaceae bacterium]
MLPVYNYFTAFLGFCTASVIVCLVRKDALSANYTLWWISIALGLIVLGLFPSIIDYFGRFLGIHYPPILLIIISWCLILLKLLFMDIDRSKQDRQIRILMQRLALYEQSQSNLISGDNHNERNE